jgi:GNAT superfamily N-acetyltransferase
VTSPVDIRAYTPDDEAEALALVHVQTPGAEPEALRHELRDPDRCRVRLVATVEGRLVGLGEVLQPSWLDDRHVMVIARVDAHHRAAGVGGALHRALAPHLRSGVVQLTSVADDDERSLRIAEHWGFVRYQHAIQSELALTGPRDRPPPSPGTSFVHLNALPTTPDPVLDRLLHAADTSPEALATGANGVEAFLPFPATFAVVARVGDEPAAITIATQSGVHAHVLITATHPRFRRRGLAAAIKSELHDLAVSRGVERMTTSNEAGNEGIRRLNAALGYERLSGAYRLRRSG